MHSFFRHCRSPVTWPTKPRQGVRGAIVALVNGKPVVAKPKFANTCYSFVNAKEAMNVASVYEYDPQKRSLAAVEGTVGVYNTWSKTEGALAKAWANNIWSDTLR